MKSSMTRNRDNRTPRWVTFTGIPNSSPIAPRTTNTPADKFSTRIRAAHELFDSPDSMDVDIPVPPENFTLLSTSSPSPDDLDVPPVPSDFSLLSQSSNESDAPPVPVDFELGTSFSAFTDQIPLHSPLQSSPPSGVTGRQIIRTPNNALPVYQPHCDDPLPMDHENGPPELEHDFMRGVHFSKANYFAARQDATIIANAMREHGHEPSTLVNEADRYLRTAYQAYGTRLMHLEYQRQQLKKEIESMTHQLTTMSVDGPASELDVGSDSSADESIDDVTDGPVADLPNTQDPAPILPTQLLLLILPDSPMGPVAGLIDSPMGLVADLADSSMCPVADLANTHGPSH
ncbi:hypothetical protein BU15DRAFT_65139 [Melanogaster broomeanus]|nr:hypothetical protein BU15DRAFT_65139 [Melanogaster broomeanus]